MWNPIVTDALLISRIKEVIDYQSIRHYSLTTPDLMYGSTGTAIFNYYNYKLSGNPKSLDTSLTHSQHAIDSLTEDTVKNLYLGKGISGILWGLIHLSHLGAFDFDVEDVMDEKYFSAYESQSILDMENGDYDHLLGSLGAFMVFMELEKRNSCEGIILSLSRISKRDKVGLFWEQSPCLDMLSGVINLGLAHGIPSIIVALSWAREKDLLSTATDKLISESFKWLKNNSQHFEPGSPFYPFSFTEGKENYYGPLRWCYGDLGVSIALVNIGIKNNNREIYDFGISIAKNSLKFRNEKIIDSHLCHGTAGIAHIYGRLYNYSQDETFKDASYYWFNQTIDSFSTDLESGFKAWKGKFGWVEYDGLLEGSAGIGLALISAISDIEPKWDRCLLLS